MWVFLITELMLFGGLFMAFTVYRMYYPQAFDAGSADMSIVLGSINTAVLIFVVSPFTSPLVSRHGICWCPASGLTLQDRWHRRCECSSCSIL
jgi:hypothetical protein